MKRVLIISPYFPPTNAADMQRVRMSLPFFKEFGWEVEVVAVHPKYSDFTEDGLLLQSVPPEVPVHYVGALPKRWTAKIGLGSIALRSLPYYRSRVAALLASKKFDLVYFSTTQYPVCILGAYWKRKFGVPYVIDMQDPWHSEYYRNNPQVERPPKYWFAYWLGKTLEPLAMKKVDGLIAVSQGYLTDLGARYPACKTVPQKVITFGAFAEDFNVAYHNKTLCPSALTKEAGTINIVYVGRGGLDMAPAVTAFFKAFKKAVEAEPAHFEQCRFHFIGTSYAAAGKGIPTIKPVAEAEGVGNYVIEITDRLPFFQTLNTLTDADGLFVPGSNDPQYTASKIYPYVLAGRPLFTLFHPSSSVVDFLRTSKVGKVTTLDMQEQEINDLVMTFLRSVADGEANTTHTNKDVLETYSARNMTAKQCQLFNAVVG